MKKLINRFVRIATLSVFFLLAYFSGFLSKTTTKIHHETGEGATSLLSPEHAYADIAPAGGSGDDPCDGDGPGPGGDDC